MMLPLAISASVEIDGIYYNLNSETRTAEVTKQPRKKYSGDIAIPLTVTYEAIEYSVTKIGNNAFLRCPDLNSIIIPDGVMTIGETAFADCTALSSIIIPNSVTTIGEGAFVGCSGITSVTVGNGVKSISKNMFQNCSSLAHVIIGTSVESIDEKAFSECNSITKVELNCPAIVSKEYNQSTTIANIFGSQVKEYVIGEGATNIGDYAFLNCIALTSVTLSSNVTHIGKSAFSYCQCLTSINIPDDVKTIGAFAFYECRSLTAIDIPSGVKKIGESAFAYCKGINSIDVPNSVDSLGAKAFIGCENLESITISNRTIIGIQSFDGTAWYLMQPDGAVYLGGYLYAYKGRMPENSTIDIKEGTRNIMAHVFQYYRNLVAIHTIGDID